MSKLFVAGEVFHGPGSLNELKNIKGQKAVIVIGGGSMRKSGTLDQALAYLTSAGIETQVFDGVEEDPSSATSFKGAELMRDQTSAPRSLPSSAGGIFLTPTQQEKYYINN